MAIRSASGPAPRFVAVFDVLGFKAALVEDGLADLARRYRAFEREVSAASSWEVRTAVFSDTVLMFGMPFTRRMVDESKRNALDGIVDLWHPVERQGNFFMNWAARLMATGLRLGLPLRAGVAFGDCVIVPSRNLYVG